MKAQLKLMMESEKYAGAFKNGKQAVKSYSAWRIYLKAKIAGKAVRKGVGKLATRIGKALPGIGIGVVILTWGSDVQAKGVIGGTINSGLDAVPLFGIAKFGIEVFTGDWIPDIQDDDEGQLYPNGGSGGPGKLMPFDPTKDKGGRLETIPVKPRY
jgi:hypothetical protein